MQIRAVIIPLYLFIYLFFQTVVCFPHLHGVVELGVTELVTFLSDPRLTTISQDFALHITVPIQVIDIS